MSKRPPRVRSRSARGSGTRPNRLPEQVDVVTIDRIAAGGDGVGRMNGLAVFVPRTAPGDVVQVAYVTHARHARGRVLQVLTSSAERVPAPCVHYERDRCGGCQLQHLEAAAQREARRHIVRDTLARIGHRDIPLPPIEAGEPWGYRSRLTLTLRRRGHSWSGGLHPHDDASRVFALEQCLIAHPVLVEVWASVRAVLRRAASETPSASGSRALGLPGDTGTNGSVLEAESLRLSLRLDPGTDSLGVQLVLEGGVLWPDRDAWTAAVCDADARIRGVWWTPERRVITGERGAAPATEAEYAPDAREALAFAQVNEGVAARLREFVYDAVQRFAPRRVLDGYAGTGALSARLAEAGVPVVAVEADAAGADVAAERVARAGAAGARSRVICDLVERALPVLEAPVDVVVLNPPRRGVHPDVTSWLEATAQRGIAGLVYVSCDPATLARDLTRLPSWRVETVQCFDMFPQTAHVETVCILRRENG